MVKKVGATTLPCYIQTHVSPRDCTVIGQIRYDQGTEIFRVDMVTLNNILVPDVVFVIFQV